MKGKKISAKTIAETNQRISKIMKKVDRDNKKKLAISAIKASKIVVF